ncbi:MAG TPA: deoxynucleoside kinase [Tenuifilaceae bacterium]|jgi:deoxyadenosine/deoxycytidine kinase|nr:deoxynucleoside kinase [Bacteroidales bacterium]HNY08966.1 deoxynucleoside kinase [Tenuifilaceae bacterium]MBP8642554.1 deoxynucleoside kinase [Bacteroidales bacterium]NLI87708.1 deoxynucleoside kinase [Bacteroidales bacterium]HOA08756.1 deoxynucleoside kinase [Tenuifilaceae bacterium]
MQYLVIEGNIGAGKTTLATMLANDLNANLITEQFADNPFLPKFYENPERYSFALELSFLAERYRQLNAELRMGSLFHSLTIADYYFMKSLIFAQNTLSGDELQLYKQIFQIIYNTLPKPNLYVYLHLPVQMLLRNIKKRGREYEQSITGEYLESIAQGYFDFFKQHPDYTFLIIETSKLDFVANQHDFNKIKSAIFDKTYPNGVNRLTF